MEEQFESTDDVYQQGYQDGQMDYEEEFLGELRGSSSLSVSLENRLGWETATITLVTTKDTKLYTMLLNMTSKTTESVVVQEPDVLKPHINGTFPAVSAPKQRNYGDGNMVKKPKKATASVQ